MKNVWIVVKSCEDYDDVYYYVFNSEKKALNALEYFTDGSLAENEEYDEDCDIDDVLNTIDDKLGFIEKFNNLKDLIESSKKNDYSVIEEYHCQICTGWY